MTNPDDTIRVLIPLKVRKKNGRSKILPPADYLPSEEQTQDPHVLRAIGRAWGWRRRMDAAEFSTIQELAEAVGLAERHVSRQLRLAYLGRCCRTLTETIHIANPCGYLGRMSEPPPARYRSTNWSSYNAALRKRGSMLIWVDEGMAWLALHEGRPGRPPVFSDAAIQFCRSIKVLFKLPLRQTAGMVASLLRLAGLNWSVPDCSTLCRRQKTLAVQIPYRRVDGPLNLLVDSIGIKFLGDGKWQVRKYGPQGRRQWRKVHLAMDTATSDIRAVEFTPSSDGDSPILPELLGQIPEDEQIGSVTADGA